MFALQCIFPRSILTNRNCALVRFSAQTAAGLVKVNVNDFLVPRRLGLEEIVPLPRGEGLVRKWRSRRSCQNLRKKTPKRDFCVRKWSRLGAQKAGPTLITNSMGGHRCGARIPGPERGPHICRVFALFAGSGGVF